MRTVTVVMIGLVVSFAFVFGATFIHKSKGVGAVWFMGVWLIFCLVDYCIGVFQAGYSPLDELGIHLIIFAVPAAAAYFLAR